MAITGFHHVCFTVTDLENTISFWRDVLGLTLRSRTSNSHPGLGTALMGRKWGVDHPEASIDLAVMELNGQKVEFIQYLDPKTEPFHKNPSIAGNAHLAFRVTDIEGLKETLESKGVEFHSDVNIFRETGKPEWKWCYFRDPDGIVVELVEAED
jgi:catechol 2,3-dioxygenase-like lactoylglutathione lyase family enzyme